MADHSKAYHRFFEGYTEKKVKDPKTGKTHIERTYTGWYYRNMLPEKEDRAHRRTNFVCFLVSVACFLICGCLTVHGGNLLFLTLIPQILAEVVLAMPVWDYFRSGREFEIRIYRQNQKLIPWGIVGAAGYFLAALYEIGYLCISHTCQAADVVFILLELLAGGCLAFLAVGEKQTVYDRHKSGKEVTGEAYEIN